MNKIISFRTFKKYCNPEDYYSCVVAKNKVGSDYPCCTGKNCPVFKRLPDKPTIVECDACKTKMMKSDGIKTPNPLNQLLCKKCHDRLMESVGL